MDSKRIGYAVAGFGVALLVLLQAVPHDTAAAKASALCMPMLIAFAGVVILILQSVLSSTN